MRGESESTVAPECPFLRPVTADRLWMYPTGVYCRPPWGRVRVPSRDSLIRFCLNGGYHDCPSYRRWREQETAVAGLG